MKAISISIIIFAFILPAVSDAKEKAIHLDDGAFDHCNVLIGYFSELPMWRDTGIPLTRVENTLDHIISEDPPVATPITKTDLDNVLGRASTPQDMADANAAIESSNSGLNAWRSAVASTPQDIDDWNAAIKAIYSSKITAKQIDRTLRKYCSNYTKHEFRASDLNNLLSKSQKSLQNISVTSSATLLMAGDTIGFKLSAKKLYSEYDRNEIAADAKYKGKKIVVTGTIRSLGIDILGDPYIELIGGGGFLDGVECVFPKSEQSSLIHLIKGQKVSVKGIVSGMLGEVQVDAEKLVDK